MTSEQWYYAVGGQQQGPVGVEALRQLLAEGKVRQSDLVWRQGMGNWQPAGSVAELGAANTAPTPVPACPVTPGAPPAGGPAPYGAPGYPPYSQQAPLPYAAPPAPNMQNKATTAFVISLLGLFCFGIVLGPIAIVLAVRAKAQMALTGNFAGKGLATAALIIGIIDIFGFILGIVLQFTLLRHH